MKKRVAITLLLVSAAALAYVPPDQRWYGQGVLPAVRPVRGPIRPNTATIDKESETETPLLPHRPTGSNSYLTSAIFWGKDWSSSGFADDKIVGMDRWYAGYNHSNYAAIAHGSLDYRGHIIVDAQTISAGQQEDDVPSALGEICQLIHERRIPYTRFGSFYPVYLEKRRPTGGACAINVTDMCFGSMVTPVSFVLIYNLDGDSLCDPKDTETRHSQGLAAIANVSGRAVADLMTDWDFDGLYDSSGNELDDKCAWTFNVPYVTFTNGSIWKLQGMWSDLAHQTGTGYPNANGDKGCLDGR